MVYIPVHSRDFLSGIGAAVTTTAVTYPINKVIYRQVLNGTTILESSYVMKQEGLFLLYRGVLPPLTQKCCSLSAMFGGYNSASEILKDLHMSAYMTRLSASIISGTLEAFFMPLERIQVLLVDKKYDARFKNTFHIFKDLQKYYGFREYYRGFSLIWIRNTASNSFFFMLKYEFQQYFKVSESKYTEGFKNFFCGGILGAVMATLFYPMKVMKIVIHKTVGTPFLSIPKVAHIIYNQNGGGIRNFYQGVWLNCARSLISWGVTNMTFEFLKQLMT